jgi:hypothetical protein
MSWTSCRKAARPAPESGQIYELLRLYSLSFDDSAIPAMPSPADFLTSARTTDPRPAGFMERGRIDGVTFARMRSGRTNARMWPRGNDCCGLSDRQRCGGATRAAMRGESGSMEIGARSSRTTSPAAASAASATVPATGAASSASAGSRTAGSSQYPSWEAGASEGDCRQKRRGPNPPQVGHQAPSLDQAFIRFFRNNSPRSPYRPHGGSSAIAVPGSGCCERGAVARSMNGRSIEMRKEMP